MKLNDLQEFARQLHEELLNNKVPSRKTSLPSPLSEKLSIKEFEIMFNPYKNGEYERFVKHGGTWEEWKQTH